jgi:V8-like Glu-specific endopeptidase
MTRPAESLSQETTKIIEEVKRAATLLDRERVAELCGRLVTQLHKSESALPEAEAKDVLSELRKRRFFGPMQRVADALLQTGQATPAVHRQYAQALIDLGALRAAEAVLRELAASTRDHPDEHAEAVGLLGRAYKQRYVDARRHARRSGEYGSNRNADVLRQSIRLYFDAYRESPDLKYWHGINAVACAARARRDGVPDDTVPDYHSVAAQILARIRQKGKDATHWEQATALEACVALEDEDAAIGRAHRYAEHPEVDAFALASTIRQLIEVWELDGTDGLGEAVLPILRGGLLLQENGRIDLSAAEARKTIGRLEKVLGDESFVSLEMYRMGLQRARTIARIGVERNRGLGTGFLIRGEDLAERFGSAWMLLTNAHVISGNPDPRPAVVPQKAVITFEALPLDTGAKAATYRVEKVHWESDESHLDAAIIELDRPVEGIVEDDRCEVAPVLPANDQKQGVYIIGHPGGGTLSFSIQDNLLLDYEDPVLHYRAPTEGGSSGSPVYDKQWNLIGIHHAGYSEVLRLNGKDGTYAANEGIWIQAIRRALATA